MAGKQKYKDLKYLFIRGLIHCEKWQRSRHYLKSAAEWTSKAIVSLELTPDHIKTVKQATQLEGIGPEIGLKLKEIQNKQLYPTTRPDGNKFITSAAAILVTLLELTDESLGSSNTDLVPEDVLKLQSQQRCEETFLEHTNSGFCPAWWRIEVLIKRDLVKRRSVKKVPVYQLLPLGRNIALQLRESEGSKSGHQLSLTAGCGVGVQEEAAIYTNDDGADGVVLLVDTQEMGGDRVGLGDLCRQIGRSCTRYRTEKLQCGDYSWMWRCDSVERVLPLLIERKRADDVAHSLKDGRFWKQMNKMILWKERFTKNKIEASLKYIVEGDPARYVVRCTDGCQGVGMCGNPTLTQVTHAIADLEAHPQLDVHMTTCVAETVQLLAILTDQLAQRARRGEFDMLVVRELMHDEPVVENKDYVKLVQNCVDQLDSQPSTDNQIPLSTRKYQKDQISLEEESTFMNIEKFSSVQNIPLSNMPENITISKTSEYIPLSNMSENITFSKTSEYIPLSNMSENITISKTSEYIPLSNMPENITISKTSEYIPLSNMPENITISKTSKYIPLSNTSIFDLNMNVDTFDIVSVKDESTPRHLSQSNECFDSRMKTVESSNLNMQLEKDKYCKNNEDVGMQEFRSVKPVTANMCTLKNPQLCCGEASTNKKFKLNFVSKPEYIKKMSPKPASRSKGRIYLMKMLKTSNVTNKGKHLSSCTSAGYLASAGEIESFYDTSSGTDANSYIKRRSCGIDANRYINHTPENRQAERNSAQSDSLASSPQSSCESSKIHGETVSSSRSNKQNTSPSVKCTGESENSSVHEKHRWECGGKCASCKHNMGLQLNNTTEVNRWFSQGLTVPSENRYSETEHLVNGSCLGIKLGSNESCKTLAGSCENVNMKTFALSSENRKDKSLSLSFSSRGCETRGLMDKSHSTLLCTKERSDSFGEQASVDNCEHSSTDSLPYLYSKFPDMSQNNFHLTADDGYQRSSFNEKKILKSPISSQSSGERRKRLLSVTEDKIQQVLCVLPQVDPSIVEATLQKNDNVEQTIIALLDSST